MKKILVILLFFVFSFIYSLDYTIPPNTYSIQSGDMDNDGDNDIVVGHINNETYLSILENNGNGEFALVEQLTSIETRAFYLLLLLDENVYHDFIIQNEYANLIIFFDSEFNNPYFFDIQAQLGIKAITYGDFDGDEDLDLVFSTWGAGQDNLWGVMYNLGNREFSEPEWFECPNQASNAGFYELECCDLDNNGFDDIIAYTNPETYIYYSDGNSFELDSLNCYAPNGGMVSEDFDNDSDYDIIVTHWPGGTQSHFLIYENLDDHQFLIHDVTYDNLWGQPIPVDINGDGLYDIVNVGNSIGIGIFYNIDEMMFEEAVYAQVVSYGENYFRSSFSDFDSNGTKDVAIIRYGIEESNLTILYNDGDGNFLEEPQASVGNYELEITNHELNNYPNPFNPETTIVFNLPEESQVKLYIYNIKGQKIRILLNDQITAGEHSIVWNGEDDSGKKASSGVYLYKFNVNGKTEAVKKCLLLK